MVRHLSLCCLPTVPAKESFANLTRPPPAAGTGSAAAAGTAGIDTCCCAISLLSGLFVSDGESRGAWGAWGAEQVVVARGGGGLCAALQLLSREQHPISRNNVGQSQGPAAFKQDASLLPAVRWRSGPAGDADHLWHLRTSAQHGSDHADPVQATQKGQARQALKSANHPPPLKPPTTGTHTPTTHPPNCPCCSALRGAM